MGVEINYCRDEQSVNLEINNRAGSPWDLELDVCFDQTLCLY